MKNKSILVKRKQIKKYWNERAEEFSTSPATTTQDVYQRELEILTIIQTLGEIGKNKKEMILDIGCGDGYSTLKIAKALPQVSILGIDYSQNMIDLAFQHLGASPRLKSRVSFLVGDVMELESVCEQINYDVVMTDRCLINLVTLQDQYYAISQIAARTKPGGYFICIENFVEGHENMNHARQKVGLPEIPIRWHNLYFHNEKFLKSIKRYFKVIEFKDFSSSYYFATRVIYSSMCQMRHEEPDYQHEIHRLAIHLPWIGQFSPIRMVILKKI